MATVDTEPAPHPTPVSIENPAPIPVAVVEVPAAPTPAPMPAAVGTPVNVTVVAPPPPAPNVIKGEGSTLAPTTTEADDEVTKGQRRINLVWESVQAIIAIAVTMAIIYLAIVQTPAETITNAFFLIVGFYFSRTNHERQGGVGTKPTPPPYEGR